MIYRIILTIFLLNLGTSSFSKTLIQRKANIRVELVSPDKNYTLRQGRVVSFSVTIVNTSSVPLLKTDTLTYRPSHDFHANQSKREVKLSIGRRVEPGDSFTLSDTLTISVVESSLNHRELSMRVYAFVTRPETQEYGHLLWEDFKDQEDNTSTRTYAFDGFLNTSNFQLTNIKIFPNPAESYIQIESEHGIISYQVWSLEGVPVIKNDIRSSTTIPISDLPSGIYLLKLRDEHGQVYTSQFIKI
jgi:hypothetical protein